MKTPLLRLFFLGLGLSFFLWTPVLADPKISLTSDLIWSDHRDYFGGFSGLEVDPTGCHISVISDAGYMAFGQLIRDGDVIESAELTRITSLKNRNGTDLRQELTDSEGFAIDAAGAAYISFEEHHRLMSVNLETGIVTLLPNHPDFPRFDVNAGLEALAVHPDGTLYTLPETKAFSSADFPLYALLENRWKITRNIPRSGPFLPVAADFADDGRFYLLERAATPLGFRSRIRRFHADPNNLAEETILTTAPGQLDNMEAMGLWTDEEGHLRIILLADDNWLKIQKIQLVEFTLQE